jgi:predicted transcriptional regulator
MIRFFRRYADRRSARLELGHLERTVTEILWVRGESSVDGVTERLRAYTTVRTTPDRLLKKGLLKRRMSERAFLYSDRFSRQEWVEKPAGELVAGFLAGSHAIGGLLISSLVEAVGQHDETLLEELERKIKLKRRELHQSEKP